MMNDAIQAWQRTMMHRRRLLKAALGAAAAQMLAPDFESRAAGKTSGKAGEPDSPQSVSQLYALLRGAGEGHAAYWVSRGIRYARRGLELVPLNRSVMISSVVFSSGEAGAMVSRILEVGLSLDLQGAAPITGIANPFAAGRIEVPHIAPMTIGYVAYPDGRLEMPAGDPRRASTDFQGRLTRAVTFSGQLAVDERFESRTTSSTGRVSQLTEEITYRGPAPRRAGAPAKAARKRMSVIRDWPYPAPAGVAHSLFAVYEGEKFRTAGAAVAEAGGEWLEQIHPGFVSRLAEFR